VYSEHLQVVLRQQLVLLFFGNVRAEAVVEGAAALVSGQRAADEASKRVECCT